MNRAYPEGVEQQSPGLAVYPRLTLGTGCQTIVAGKGEVEPLPPLRRGRGQFPAFTGVTVCLRATPKRLPSLWE